MADEATTPAATEAPVTPAPAATPPADATGPNSGASDRTFTQAELNQIIKERLEQERGKAQKEAAKAQADAEAKVLAEQGKYKELFEKQQAELQAAQAEAKTAAVKLLQREVAAETKLPLPLADRLRGETKDEMVADAKAIMAALPKPEAPNINAQSGVGGAPAAGQLSEAQIAELAAAYGVSPALLKQQLGKQ